MTSERIAGGGNAGRHLRCSKQQFENPWMLALRAPRAAKPAFLSTAYASPGDPKRIRVRLHSTR